MKYLIPLSILLAFALTALGVAWCADVGWRSIWNGFRRRPFLYIVLGAFAVATALYGAQKPMRSDVGTIPDPGAQMNNVFRLDALHTILYHNGEIDGDARLYIYRRPYSSNNDADWILWRTMTVGDLPYETPLPNVTNYAFFVHVEPKNPIGTWKLRMMRDPNSLNRYAYPFARAERP